MSWTLYLAYVAACAAVVAVPGPTVTVIIANSLAYGRRAGLLNVAGTQVGLLVMMAILAAGLSIIVAQAAVVFDIVRLLGAAYLIYLGVRLWRSDGALAEATAEKGARNFFLQGFLVILSNPKALIFFGAFIPQFVDPSAPATPQIVLLAATFMVVATAIDGAYAVAAGSLGRRLTRTRIRLLERVSGTFLIAGGIWLALSRRA